MDGRDARQALELADYRARVADLYLTSAGKGPEAVEEFRHHRDRLFAEHPASALTVEQKAAFEGLSYFPYAPMARVRCEVLEPREPGELEIDSGGEDGVLRYSRVGRLGTPWGELTLFWTEGYGGNLFLPFRDATAPEQTYGAGRYLTDAIKGTFGGGVEPPAPGGDHLFVTLDFNYAYNPSCAYNSRWACPLAPPENRLTRAIQAGELKFPHAL